VKEGTGTFKWPDGRVRIVKILRCTEVNGQIINNMVMVYMLDIMV
jgi:predicted metal-binding protein